MKIQLILEGGGMRGMYTAGVLDYFLENEIIIKNIIGVSAGVGNALSYASNQIGRTKETVLKYCTDKRYLSFRSYLKTGSFFGIDFIFKEIPEKLILFDYDKFKASGIKVEAVVTNLETAQAEYHMIKDVRTDIDYIIASSSLPLASKTVIIDSKKYVDGGIADPIPIRYSIEQGYDFQIVVLTRPAQYRKLIKNVSFVIKKKYAKYKNFLNVMEKRAQNYNDTLALLETLEQAGKVILIRPAIDMELDIFEKDISTLEMLYNLGYKDAARKEADIIKILKETEY